jgi:two-component system phosphate regulon sensor histidine kinase PhoR
MEAFLDARIESMARAALDGGSAAGEVRFGDADGPALVVRARRTGAGGLWLVIDDVSELRRLQRIRAEFIDNLSHELRTPLTTVSLLSETLSREAEGAGDAIPPRMRERIAKIEVETGHLVQMVNEILDLSRIESGGTLNLVEDLDVGRLAAESAERLRLFAERQGVSLRIDTDRDLPRVRGDTARLGQVVVNLVHNAVKFSPDGGEITVRARAVANEVVTSVEDHGVGIPRAAQGRVFERFYKVDRARLRAEAGGGTGLGLAIARHVIEQHGGRIWLESVEGSGSTFSFALPVPAEPTS